MNQQIAIIDELPALRLRTLKPFIAAALKNPEAASLSAKNFLNIGKSLSIDVTFFPSSLTFLFRWDYGGEERLQKVTLQRTPSNLKKGSSVLWFRCPFSGSKTRTLYTDRFKLFSRGVVKHRYRAQTLSRLQRLTESKYFTEDWRYPEKGRKEFYRGELTPYGRRQEKKAERTIRAYKAMAQHIGLKF